MTNEELANELERLATDESETAGYAVFRKIRNNLPAIISALRENDDLKHDLDRAMTTNTEYLEENTRMREALGFNDERKHARFNLEGALEDLTNSNGNDAVTRRTIARVCWQLAEAERAVSPEPDTPATLGHT